MRDGDCRCAGEVLQLYDGAGGASAASAASDEARIHDVLAFHLDVKVSGLLVVRHAVKCKTATLDGDVCRRVVPECDSDSGVDRVYALDQVRVHFLDACFGLHSFVNSGVF
ncbi:MAG: hypothetical protein IKV66_11610 [Clostridia bacterium]|nr:hypothetical protein [Clostridia bacterium]